MTTSFTLLALALLFAGSLAQQPNVSFNSSIVSQVAVETSSSQKDSWCLSQVNLCGILCSGQVSTNDCERNTLAFDCACSSNNSAPGLQYYSGSMTSFICNAALGDCITSNAGSQAQQATCKSNFVCGDNDNPPSSASSSSTALQPATSSSSTTSLQTASTPHTTISSSSSSSITATSSSPSPDSLSTTPSSAASASSTPLTSASPSPTSTPSSNNSVAIGAGVGVPLGVLALAGLAFFAWRSARDRRRLQEMQQVQQYTPSTFVGDRPPGQERREGIEQPLRPPGERDTERYNGAG